MPIAVVIIVHSRMCLEIHGRKIRIRKVANANAPRISPMVEADRPIDVP